MLKTPIGFTCLQCGRTYLQEVEKEWCEEEHNREEADMLEDQAELLDPNQ